MFQFFVRAEDSGLPSPVDVLILDLQERSPVFERTSSKYFISESAPVGKKEALLSPLLFALFHFRFRTGTTIARVKASNGGEALHYSIVPPSKNPKQDHSDDDEAEEVTQFFSVDDQGQIFLSAPLDRETCDTHIITILASTDASPPVIASTEVIIQVLDTNEHPPEFESNPYHVVVAENAEKGTSVVRGIKLPLLF